MKKIRITLLACLACLFVVSCDKQEESDAPLVSAKRFRIEAPQFRDENGQKVYLQYTDAASSLIYEEGDVVYINGHPCSMSIDGGVWYANSDEEIVGKRFLVTYVDGDVTTFDSTACTYEFNMNDNLDNPASNKAILGGVAESDGDNVITLQPACAILRIDTKGAGANYDYIKVGFEGRKIPKAGTINVSNRALSAGSNSNYMNGVAQGGGGVITGDFLYMTRRHAGESDYWYVAIPIEGSSVTTTLYLQWTINGGTPVQRKTQGQVTMTKGYVYTLGTDRVSPFYDNGSTKSQFRVGNDTRVRFSAGNLQYAVAFDNGGNRIHRWRFANHQYDVIGSSNNNIGRFYEDWIDLFGWGTSGWNSGAAAYLPYSSSSSYNDYQVGGVSTNNLTGSYANADWGVYNSANIVYGNSASGVSDWRTLTSDEWTYLLNNNPNGLATVNGTYYGLVVLPVSWSLPEGCSFNAGAGSGFSTNTYSLAQWDKMEMAGAIFLPIGGYRNGSTTYSITTEGWYWSSTQQNVGAAYALKIISSSKSVTSKTRYSGCSVRLVREIE